MKTTKRKIASAMRVPTTIMGSKKELKGSGVSRALYTNAMNARHQGALQLTQQIPQREKILATVLGMHTHLHWN